MGDINIDELRKLSADLEKRKKQIQEEASILDEKQKSLEFLQDSIGNRKNVSEELSEKNSLLKRKKKEILDLERQEEDIRKDLQELLIKKKEWQREIIEAQNINKKEKELEIREQEFRSALQDLERIKEIVEDKTQELKKESKELETKKGALVQEERQRDHVKKEIRALLIRENALRNAVKEDRSRIKEVNRKQHILEKTGVPVNLLEKEAELKELEKSLDKKRKMIIELAEKARKSSKTGVEMARKQKIGELGSLETELIQKDEILQKQQEQIDELKIAIKENQKNLSKKDSFLNKKHEDLASVLEEQGSLKKELAILKKENLKLKKTLPKENTKTILKEATILLEEKEKEHFSLKSELKNKHELVKKNQKIIEKKQEQLSSLTKERDDLKKEVESLKKKLVAKPTSTGKLQSLLVETANSLIKKKSENPELESLLEETGNALIHKEEEYLALKKEVNELRVLHKNKEKEVIIKGKSLEKLEEHNTQLKTTVDNLQKHNLHLKDSTKSIASLEKEILKLDSLLNKTLKEKESAISDLNLSRIKNIELKSELNLLNKTKKVESSNLKKQLIGLTSVNRENLNLKEKHKKLEIERDMHAEVSKEIPYLKKNIEELKKEVSSIQEIKNKTLDELKQQFADRILLEREMENVREKAKNDLIESKKRYLELNKEKELELTSLKEEFKKLEREKRFEIKEWEKQLELEKQLHQTAILNINKEHSKYKEQRENELLFLRSQLADAEKNHQNLIKEKDSLKLRELELKEKISFLNEKEKELNYREKTIIAREKVLEKNEFEWESKLKLYREELAIIEQKVKEKEADLEAIQLRRDELVNTISKHELKISELLKEQGSLDKMKDKVIKAEEFVEKSRINLSKKEIEINKSLKELEKLRKTFDSIPVLKSKMELYENTWNERSKVLSEANDDLSNIHSAFIKSSSEVIGDIALVNAKEKELDKIVVKIEEDMKYLGDKEHELAILLKKSEIKENEVLEKEELTKVKEETLNKLSKELADKEVKINRAKELHEQIKDLKLAHDNWRDLVNKEKSEYNSDISEILTKREYLKDFESKLSKKILDVDKKEERIKNSLPDVSTILRNIQEVLQSVKELIEQNRFDEAKKIINEAEKMTLPEQDKRKLTYGLMELKTELRLAQL